MNLDKTITIRIPAHIWEQVLLQQQKDPLRFENPSHFIRCSIVYFINELRRSKE